MNIRNPASKTLTIAKSHAAAMSDALIAWFKSLLRRWSSPKTGAGAAAHAQVDDGIDPELAEVFFHELGEVTKSLTSALATWRAHPNDQDALKKLKRGFHTLKGSAPLIGATALGEFAAQLERLIIRQIEKPLPATTDLYGTVEQAILLLPAFAHAARQKRPPPPMVRAVGHRVKSLLA